MNHQSSRVELAAALRWAARMGWQSGICNHFSLAVDNDDGSEGILINPQGYQWSELTASSLLLLDTSGQVVEGDGSVEDTAFFIHLAVHRSTPSARCVLHAHPPYSTAIMCTRPGRLLNCHQDSLKFHGRIAYDDNFGGIAGDEAEGNRIADSLESQPIVLMANHGVSVTGRSVWQALDDFYYLESAARFQILAQSTGTPLKIIDDAEADRLAPGFQTDQLQAQGYFESILRILDKEEPEFRR
jgi:ribulose-5-phosphate 4-epimerase/fuculose-1-phosphate aldolase